METGGGSGMLPVWRNKRICGSNNSLAKVKRYSRVRISMCDLGKMGFVCVVFLR